jgi:hypothetical protein
MELVRRQGLDLLIGQGEYDFYLRMETEPNLRNV